MKITVHLSDKSILRAIHRLNQASQNLRWGVSDTVEILTQDGAGIAQASYGGMANAVGYMQDETVGIIATSGEANLIAEFGAGDATDPATGFENQPDTPVYAGSYSESEEGSGEYARTGRWHFGGRVYTEIPARRGLFNAKAYIIETAAETAKEVIKL